MVLSVSDSIISVEGLSKRYRLDSRTSSESYTALRDVLADKAKSLFRPNGSSNVSLSDSQRLSVSNGDFWALQDVSFEVGQGEVVGIIGRNGAGKSTLLKILSRITEPTEGRVRIKGRVASLLEVGTGFHPELTGRENIYLNGAILGLRRFEIKARFDEIVAFAEIEKFLDTPVKRYSSGMYVRLAFAVAAHLDPEILIIDEVLSVGDSEFQKKSLGKMQQVAKGEGRTVLFVSHQMNAIESLCSRALLISSGRLEEQGNDVRQVIKRYLDRSDSQEKAPALPGEWPAGASELTRNRWFNPTRFLLTDDLGQPINEPLRNDSSFHVQIEGEVEQADPALCIGFAIFDRATGQLLFQSQCVDRPEEDWPDLARGPQVLRCQIPPHLLNEGSYRLELMVSLHFREWLSEPGRNAPAIQLVIQCGLSDSPYWMHRRPGLLAPILDWSGFPTARRKLVASTVS